MSSEMPSRAKYSAWHGDEEAVGGDEGVEGEEVECRGAVEEDEGIVGANGGEGVAETIFAAILSDELDVGPDEVLGAGDEGEVGDVGGDDDLVGGCVVHEEVVDAEAGLFPVCWAAEAAPSGGVGLKGSQSMRRVGEAFPRARAAKLS